MITKEASIPCPDDECGKSACFLVGLALPACVTAGVEALAQHILEDHVGHKQSCDRYSDRHAACECGLYLESVW